MTFIGKAFIFCIALVIGFCVGLGYQIVLVKQKGEIMIKYVEPKTLKQGDLILDVRTPVEQAEKSLALSHWRVPVDKLNPKQFAKEHHIDGKKTLNIVCKTGRHAALATEKFEKAGFKNVAVVKGGIERATTQGLEMIETATMSMERQIRLTAGIIVVLGLLSGFFITPWFYLIVLFMGAGLIFSGLTGECGLGVLLAHLPWNK